MITARYALMESPSSAYIIVISVILLRQINRICLSVCLSLLVEFCFILPAPITTAGYSPYEVAFTLFYRGFPIAAQ